MNYVILTGRLTRDTELSNTQGGTGYLRNSLAVKKDFKNQNGEYESDFFNFCAFGKTAEIIANYCSKGSLILVKGHLTNNFIINEKQQKCNIIDLIVDNVELVEPKKQEQKQPTPNDIYKQQTQAFLDSEIKTDFNSEDLPF